MSFSSNLCRRIIHIVGTEQTVISFIFIIMQYTLLAVLDNEALSKDKVMKWDLSWHAQVKCLLNDLCCISGSQGYESEFDWRSRATVSDVE